MFVLTVSNVSVSGSANTVIKCSFKVNQHFSIINCPIKLQVGFSGQWQVRRVWGSKAGLTRPVAGQLAGLLFWQYFKQRSKTHLRELVL